MWDMRFPCSALIVTVVFLLEFTGAGVTRTHTTPSYYTNKQAHTKNSQGGDQWSAGNHYSHSTHNSGTSSKHNPSGSQHTIHQSGSQSKHIGSYNNAGSQHNAHRDDSRQTVTSFHHNSQTIGTTSSSPSHHSHSSQLGSKHDSQRNPSINSHRKDIQTKSNDSKHQLPQKVPSDIVPSPPKPESATVLGGVNIIDSGCLAGFEKVNGVCRKMWTG